jgi:predicted  nucleic acid-binding Zn-ribbon protein
MTAFQKNLALENEMKQLRSMSSTDRYSHHFFQSMRLLTQNNSHEAVEELRAQIAEYQQELTTTKRRLAEAEITLSQGTGGSPVMGSAEHERLKRQLDSFEKESRLQMAQINKLSMEKDHLENQMMELKDSLLQQERSGK